MAARAVVENRNDQTQFSQPNCSASARVKELGIPPVLERPITSEKEMWEKAVPRERNQADTSPCVTAYFVSSAVVRRPSCLAMRVL